VPPTLINAPLSAAFCAASGDYFNSGGIDTALGKGVE